MWSLTGSWIKNKKPSKERNGPLLGKCDYEISATQKYNPWTHVICELLLICGEVSTKSESKHLETFTEMWQSNFMPVESNHILCIYVYFIFPVIHFIVHIKASAIDGKFKNRSFTTDSSRSTLLENNIVPILNFLSVILILWLYWR